MIAGLILAATLLTPTNAKAYSYPQVTSAPAADNKSGVVVLLPDFGREFGPLSKFRGSEKWKHYAIPGWIQKTPINFGATAAQAAGCSGTLQLSPLMDHRENYLYIEFENKAGDTRLIDLKNIELKFDNGTTQNVETKYVPSYPPIPRGWRFVTALPLPTKKPFRGANAIVATIPLLAIDGTKTCTQAIELTRDPRLEPELRSYEAGTLFEVAIGAGSAVARAGDSSQFAGPGGALLLDVYGHPFHSPHHGVFFGALVDYMGNKNPQLLNAATAGSANPSPLQAFFGIGYSYRWAPGPENFQMSYELAPAYALFSLRPAGAKKNTVYSNAGFMQQLNLDWLFTSIHSGPATGDFSLGLTLFHGWVPTGTANSISISGHTFGFGIRFKAGS